MTTQAQIKKILQPMIRRNSDLLLLGRNLIVKPLRHVIKSIDMETSRFTDALYPTKFRVHLTGQLGWYPIAETIRICPPRRNGWLRSDENDMELMIHTLETDTIPLLRTLDDLDLYAADARIYEIPEHAPLFFHHRTFPCTIARDDLEAARTFVLERVDPYDLNSLKSDRRYDDFDIGYMASVRRLCPLLAADDRKGMAALLHEFEAISVKKMKLEHLWEPTPFPLELMG